MKQRIVLLVSAAMVVLACFSFKDNSTPQAYLDGYKERLNQLTGAQEQLLTLVKASNLEDSSETQKVRSAIHQARLSMKGMDFWLRYLSPNDYRKINGPLPVEWETEVFEKFEKPYRREGAGLTLAE